MAEIIATGVGHDELVQACHFYAKDRAAKTPGKLPPGRVGRVVSILERVEGMMQKLDDDNPDVRDRTMLELHGEVYTFEPLFRAVVKEAPPGEIRNRLTNVLAWWRR